MRLISFSGETLFPKMTSQIDAKQYAIRKMYAWNSLLKEKEKPITWKKPSKKGTRVKWESIDSQEDCDIATNELEGYIYSLNKTYGTDYVLKRKEEES